MDWCKKILSWTRREKKDYKSDELIVDVPLLTVWTALVTFRQRDNFVFELSTNETFRCYYVDIRWNRVSKRRFDPSMYYCTNSDAFR